MRWGGLRPRVTAVGLDSRGKLKTRDWRGRCWNGRSGTIPVFQGMETVFERIRSVSLGVLFFWAPLAFFARAADGFTLTKEITAALSLALWGTLLVFARGKGVVQWGLARWG